MTKEIHEYSPGAAKPEERFRVRFFGPSSGKAHRVIMGSYQIDALMVLGSGEWSIRSGRDLSRAICAVRGMEYSDGWGTQPAGRALASFAAARSKTVRQRARCECETPGDRRPARDGWRVECTTCGKLARYEYAPWVAGKDSRDITLNDTARAMYDAMRTALDPALWEPLT